jgi:DNA polymerase III gamma/tau subunit
MSSASMTAALALISGLPREELQSLTKEISTLMASSPKEKVKRVAAVGQKAWFAFMRHCRDTMADRFTAGLKAPEIAVICKAIRAEDEAVYTAFVEKFKEENPAPSAPVAATPSAPAPAVAPAPKPVAKASAKLTAEEKALEKEQKAAAKSAEKEAKSAEKQQKAATKSAEKAAEKEAARLAKEGARLAKEAEKEAAKQQKAAEKEAAKQAKLAAKPTKAKATKAKATAPISAEATPAPAEPEEDVMPKITIGAVTYFHDESSNGLYGIDAATNGLSHWVGFFQPDNEAEPIRYTASEGDDE